VRLVGVSAGTPIILDLRGPTGANRFYVDLGVPSGGKQPIGFTGPLTGYDGVAWFTQGVSGNESPFFFPTGVTGVAFPPSITNPIAWSVTGPVGSKRGYRDAVGFEYVPASGGATGTVFIQAVNTGFWPPV